MKKSVIFSAMASLLVGTALLAITQRGVLPQNWLEDVVYRDIERRPGDEPGLDRAAVELLFSREPLSPVTSFQVMKDGMKEQVFFFPMVDAVSNMNSRTLKKFNTKSGKLCGIVLDPVEGPEHGLKVTFRYDPDGLSVVCHIGLEGDRRRVRFRLHDKSIIRRLEQFNALRMARLFGGGYRMTVFGDGIALM